MSNGTEMTLQKFVQGDTLRSEMAKVLPKHVTPERMARVAWTAIVRNPQLSNCDRNSLATAILLCCQAGLEPDGRNAHLIPFGDKVQVIFDYKGLVTLAKRNGVDAKASLVCAHDDFEYVEDDGSGATKVTHRFSPFDDRGPIVGAYSRALEAGKAPDYEFMSKDEIEAIRKRSRAGGNGPWVTDFGEMAKKTVLRRHSKRWDLLPEIRDVINQDDDTPPPLVAAAPSAPIFTPKLAAPAPEPELAPAEPPTYNLVKALRGLCREKKLKESDVLGFIAEIGFAPLFESFENAASVEGGQEMLQKIHDDLDDIAARIAAAKAVPE